ncbi:MAG: hypothetical protein JW878_03575 [Methanomicrobia archaeon]|nr:hypothetical protein [Methanomicrobia archaeon]
MMTKIWTIGVLVVIATGVALGSTQLYLGDSQTAEAECEGCGCGGKVIDENLDIESRGYVTGVIEDYRGGQSDCQGGSESWNDAVCRHNAIIRWSGESQYAPAFEDEIEQCYWQWSAIYPEHCYPDWDDGSQDDPVYYTYIGNNDLEFYHAVCAEHEGGSTSDFDNWRFFQYREDDIEPGDWQMPCGTDTDDTYVLVQSTNDVGCDNIDATTSYSWYIDENCNVSSSKISLAQVTDDDVALMKSKIKDLKENPKMQIAAWDIDRGIKRVTLWVYERTSENQQLHRKMIDGWEIIVAEDQKSPEITAETNMMQ